MKKIGHQNREKLQVLPINFATDRISSCHLKRVHVFLPKSLERLSKSANCSKHIARVTQRDDAVFITTHRVAQLSPNLP